MVSTTWNLTVVSTRGNLRWLVPQGQPAIVNTSQGPSSHPLTILPLFDGKWVIGHTAMSVCPWFSFGFF